MNSVAILPSNWLSEEVLPPLQPDQPNHIIAPDNSFILLRNATLISYKVRAIPFELLIPQRIFDRHLAPEPPTCCIRICGEHPDTLWLQQLDSILEKKITPHLKKKHHSRKGLIRRYRNHQNNQEFDQIRAKILTVHVDALLKELSVTSQGVEENTGVAQDLSLIHI